MAPGQEIDGPALIETETTTVLVGAGDRATIMVTSWIDIVLVERRAHQDLRGLPRHRDFR